MVLPPFSIIQICTRQAPLLLHYLVHPVRPLLDGTSVNCVDLLLLLIRLLLL